MSLLQSCLPKLYCCGPASIIQIQIYHAFLLILRALPFLGQQMKGILVKTPSVLPGSTSLEFPRDQLEFHTFCIRRCLQTYQLYIHFRIDISFPKTAGESKPIFSMQIWDQFGLCFYCFYAIIPFILLIQCTRKSVIIYLKSKSFHN